MSVYLGDVVMNAGYNYIDNVDDAKWLLAQKDEFLAMCEKAEETVDDYEEYEWDMQEMEDSGDNGHKMSFDEWRKAKYANEGTKEKIELKFPELPTLR